MHAYIHTLHTYTYACILTYIHYMHTYIPYMNECIHTYIACIHTYVNIYIHTHTHIHTLHTYTHTHTHSTHIHTYIHTYITPCKSSFSRHDRFTPGYVSPRPEQKSLLAPLRIFRRFVGRPSLSLVTIMTETSRGNTINAYTASKENIKGEDHLKNFGMYGVIMAQ